MVETEVQNGVDSSAWPGKGKINTKQLLHSSVLYLAHPRQDLPLLPSLTGNCCAYKQPPRPPLAQGRQTMGQKNPAQSRPLPEVPRGLTIGKHKAIFNVLFVYQVRLRPEKQYLWEVALIFSFFFLHLLRQSHIFATFRKAKKATLSKGDLFPSLPFWNALSGVSGEAALSALHWSVASKVQSPGSGMKGPGIPEESQ